MDGMMKKSYFCKCNIRGSYFGQYIYKRIILIVVMRKHKQKLTNVHTKIFSTKDEELSQIYQQYYVKLETKRQQQLQHAQSVLDDIS